MENMQVRFYGKVEEAQVNRLLYIFDVRLLNFDGTPIDFCLWDDGVIFKSSRGFKNLPDVNQEKAIEEARGILRSLVK